MIIKAAPGIALSNMFVLFFQSLLPAVTLYITKEIIDLITNPAFHQFKEIVWVIIGYSLVQLTGALLTQLSAYLNALYEQKLTDHLSSLVLEKAVSVDYAYYENPSYHDTLHLAQQQYMFKATRLLNNFYGLFTTSLTLFFLGSLFISLHWVYAIVLIFISVPLTVVRWYFSKLGFAQEKKLAEADRESHYLQHVLTGINYAKEVRLFGLGKAFIPQYNQLRNFLFKNRRKLQNRQNIYSLLTELFEIIVLAFLFFGLAKNAWEKTITVGLFVIYLQGFQKLQSAAKSMLQTVIQLYLQKLFLRHLFEFLDLEGNAQSTNQKAIPINTAGLVVEHLHFSYPGTNQQVLNDISLTCKPGEIIAIVGENGSGKSTLVKLLAKLYHLQEGNIFLDGVHYADVDDELFRKQSVFLFQDFEKYFFSIAENIALGIDAKDFDIKKLKEASLKSDVQSFMHKMGKGFDTRLGRSFRMGEQLSGGQWQKLALARVFYRDAHLVVLDEPTSALDALAEHALFNELKELAVERIVVLVSHRLYNIKMADRIYVMKNGEIAEEGSFNDLIKKMGLFYNMYEKQKLD